MRPTAAAFGGALLALAAAARAAAPEPALPDRVQQDAMSCAGEAAQICPEVWTAPDHGLACMTGKRELFSPRCRAVYDEVARALGRR
ncbi:hypothetical protein [Lichenibacterium dinghuense]|uniref:hypothetical protein n=1 Tax=Lichenibacterium dinghuense TaxID=2895977 RepID=UPI001F43A98A|nr:hypothetical protein [Lichenibacterium sp. 6Y81]